jgi:hypothetical protein
MDKKPCLRFSLQPCIFGINESFCQLDNETTQLFNEVSCNSLPDISSTQKENRRFGGKLAGRQSVLRMYLIDKIAKTKFVRTAVEEKADLSAFKERPTVRIILGVSAIGISYIIGWPAVALLGTLSVYFKDPLIVVIGGPVTYGLSHLVFLLGMYLAGAKYTKIFLRWAVRVMVEKFS